MRSSVASTLTRWPPSKVSPLQISVQRQPAGNSTERDLRSVVVVRLGDMRLLGFVTRDDLPELEAQAGGIDLVAVYLPMSYGIGGYTVYLPKDQCESLDMPVETAMRMALTAGMSSGPPPAR